jgi:hypothetical protein
VQAKACSAIDQQLEAWQARLPSDLAAVPVEAESDEWVDGHRITFSTYKQVSSSGDTLIVFSAFVHTWSGATYWSFGAVGRLYVEGLVVSADGEVRRAPDEALWGYR